MPKIINYWRLDCFRRESGEKHEGRPVSPRTYFTAFIDLQIYSGAMPPQVKRSGGFSPFGRAEFETGGAQRKPAGRKALLGTDGFW